MLPVVAGEKCFSFIYGFSSGMAIVKKRTTAFPKTAFKYIEKILQECDIIPVSEYYLTGAGLLTCAAALLVCRTEDISIRPSYFLLYPLHVAAFLKSSNR